MAGIERVSSEDVSRIANDLFRGTLHASVLGNLKGYRAKACPASGLGRARRPSPPPDATPAQLAAAAAPLETGHPVRDGSRDLGEIVTATSATTSLALAVLPLDRTLVALSANGTNLREIPLLEGLAR